MFQSYAHFIVRHHHHRRCRCRHCCYYVIQACSSMYSTVQSAHSSQLITKLDTNNFITINSIASRSSETNKKKTKFRSCLCKKKTIINHITIPIIYWKWWKLCNAHLRRDDSIEFVELKSWGAIDETKSSWNFKREFNWKLYPIKMYCAYVFVYCCRVWIM